MGALWFPVSASVSPDLVLDFSRPERPSWHRQGELPAGYATMLVLALIPPVWRHVMDHRVLAHYGGDATLANTAAGYRPPRTGDAPHV
jgi:hypothetical protein